MTEPTAQPDDARPPRRLLLRGAGFLLCTGCWLVVIAWIVGRALTDRYDYSQWLWWLPTPAAIAAAALGIVGAARPALRRGVRLRRIGVWLVVLLGVLAWYACIEHRLLTSAPPPSQRGLSIAHWNMSHPHPDAFDPYARAALQLDADVLVLSSPSLVSARGDVLAQGSAGRTVHRYGLFSVVTSLEIVRARPLVNRERMWSYMIELDSRAALGRNIIIYMIDLPAIDWENPGSTFERSRMDVAERFADLLAAADAPPADVVIGDFNITRGSASISRMFPALHHAWNDGGYGYSATFHREWPYVHIDHILLAPNLRALRYDLIDPGMGRHLAQRARIVAE